MFWLLSFEATLCYAFCFVSVLKRRAIQGGEKIAPSQNGVH